VERFSVHPAGKSKASEKNEIARPLRLGKRGLHQNTTSHDHHHCNGLKEPTQRKSCLEATQYSAGKVREETASRPSAGVATWELCEKEAGRPLKTALVVRGNLRGRGERHEHKAIKETEGSGTLSSHGGDGKRRRPATY